MAVKLRRKLLNLIEDRQMIPEPAFLDVEMLVSRLDNELPGQFAALAFKRYQFSINDFTSEGSAKFCSAVVEDKDDSNMGASVLWKLLDEEQKAKFNKWSDGELKPEERRDLLAIMNGIIEKRNVYEAQSFRDHARSKTRHKEVPPTEVALLEKADRNKGESQPLDAESTRRLNRILLSLAFKEHFSLPNPLVIETPLWKPISIRIQTLNAHEAFMIWLKAAFLSGLVMGQPLDLPTRSGPSSAPGLYPHERKYVYLYLPFSLILFMAGASMAFFFVFEHVLNFLFSFNESMEIDPDPRISEWLSFVLLLPIGFGVAFQLPLGMLFLYRMGIFTNRGLPGQMAIGDLDHLRTFHAADARRSDQHAAHGRAADFALLPWHPALSLDAFVIAIRSEKATTRANALLD